ncbi:phosphotransferase [Mycoplasma sp. 1018B]|uniref:phosphotransferase n=1 Tax=Mycoplasma sp. 1018B TaxID=2967302 RepID=UPI00211D0590|nr:phosphotransferase [Mycoplasma sp. 1018B]UUM19038.1 phosphotransferase [Mycoplasma sp. 1018B]
MKTKITIGYTNKSYKKDDYFLQIKKRNKFNHKIDYKILKIFTFVPKLLKNTYFKSKWEFIETEKITISKENLTLIAQNMLILHNSNLVFPKTNHFKRINWYWKQLKRKNINLEVIDKYKYLIEKILKQQNNNWPLHNDLWTNNLLKKDHKIYFIDWEYASMGDFHFELAYFITLSNLNYEEEEYFLKKYKNFDQTKLIENKILVNYLVILWLYSQKKLHFSHKPFEDKIYQLLEELKIKNQ